jgi:outer membrane lipoprotein SlyB
MKNFSYLQIFILCISILFLCSCYTEKTYITWVKSYEKAPYRKGVLTELTDSSLVIQHKNVSQDIHISNIEKIRVRRRDRISNGAVIGALSGLALGIISGFAAGDDPPCSGWFCLRWTAKEKAQAGAILGGIGGAMIGAIFGSAKTTIPINGNMDHYQKQKIKLKKYLNER